jgi:hypothetical protein
LIGKPADITGLSVPESINYTIHNFKLLKIIKKTRKITIKLEKILSALLKNYFFQICIIWLVKIHILPNIGCIEGDYVRGGS